MYYYRMEISKTGKLKIGVIGNSTYENKRKIKEFLFEVKKKFGDNVQIISGGNKKGADSYIRKFCIEFGLDYKEFNPPFTTKNLYSVMNEEYYNKNYHVTLQLKNNELLSKYIDKAVVFKSEDSDKFYVDDVIKKLQKQLKSLVLISDKD